jgi:hypothetical protein
MAISTKIFQEEPDLTRPDSNDLRKKLERSDRTTEKEVHTLRAAGVTALDPWWSRLGWDDNAPIVEEEVYRRVLDEEHRRVQIDYAEIVQASFPELASKMTYFPNCRSVGS